MPTYKFNVSNYDYSTFKLKGKHFTNSVLTLPVFIKVIHIKIVA